MSRGFLKVISSILSNLSAGWIGSIIIFPGFFKIEDASEFVILLTYSITFDTFYVFCIEDRKQIIINS